MQIKRDKAEMSVARVVATRCWGWEVLQRRGWNPDRRNVDGGRSR